MGLHIFVRGFAGLTNEGAYKRSNSSAEFITIQARGRGGGGYNQMHLFVHGSMRLISRSL